MPDQARWFDSLGICVCGCGKPATGTLRGPTNASYGNYTQKCAEKRIKKAERDRDRQALENMESR